jgi:Xaa-Pro aminopeptidase
MTARRAAFAAEVGKALVAGRRIHFLPPYRPGISIELGALLGVAPADVKAKASPELIAAVVAQRLVKSAAEVAEIEAALGVTAEMYLAAMSLCRPGRHEREVAGAMEGIALSLGCRQAFPPIVTINGQILHSHGAVNELARGRLLVVDAGAESWLHYASDITRTIPVGGKFSRRQRDIYDIVLAGQTEAIAAIKPGIRYKDVHLKTAKIMAAGLKDLGLMRGDTDAAVTAGAHALFFVHGLGHNLGLDVHDMESLGENNVGYDETVARSGQFGLAYLRMAKALRPGHVLTVEPGLYFIPALYAQWRKEKKFTDFIAYDKVEKFLDFGGVRIEDDIVVTAKGCRVLGPPIPKTAAAVEKACA